MVYLPVGEGPWPVAFTRTPYGNIQGDQLVLGQEYAKRGMGFIQQYCRGKGGSEGEYVANEDERADGIASLNWLAEQEWCESIGMHGLSYMALTTWIVGDSLPDKVKALHVQQYGVDRQLSLYKDGLVRVDVITAWTMQNVPMAAAYEYDSYIAAAQYLPQIGVPATLWGTELPDYIDWVNHPNYQDAYWNQGVWGDLKNAIDKIDVPVTVVAGIYDHHLQGTLEGYNRLNNSTKAQSRLVLGPWVHGFGNAIQQFTEAKNIGGNMTLDTFNWLYNLCALKNEPDPGIEVYFIGEDKWVELDSWPIIPEDSATYYLTNQDTASNGTAFALQSSAETEGKTMTYVYDPTNPKWTEGGETLLTSGKLRGSKPLSSAGYRDDVLTFITDPLTENLSIAGEISVKLFVSTDMEDTAFAITVSEIGSDGTAYNIRNGITTLGYRNDPLGNRQTYTPGEIVEINIDTLPMTWNVKEGNRIRVDISSSNFPEYSIHTNTAGSWAEQTEYNVANQVIYLGGETPSSITFPTIDLTKR